MQILFYTRDFGKPLSSQFTWEVESYEWEMIWGPTLATLTAPELDPDFDTAKLIRCPVVIINGDGWPVWWGYVHTASIPRNKINIGLSVANMYNKVKVVYSNLLEGTSNPSGQGDSGWAQANDSIGEFGTKEYIESMGDATAASVTARRDRILAECKYPNVVIDPYSSGKLKLSLRGWGDSLSWKRVSEVSTSLTATTTQIANIVTAAGQFLQGTHVGTASGITTNPFQDGTVTAKKAIEELVKMGTSGGGRLKAIVTQERYLRLDAVTTPSEPDYKLRDDGLLENLSDSPVDEERLELAIGKWAVPKNAPAAIGDFATIHPFLIDGATWQKGRGASYRPVGQIDALKLTQVGV